MTDITLCANEGCNKRRSCYRATAKASDYQSMALFEPREDWGCDNYLYEPGSDADEPAKMEW